MYTDNIANLRLSKLTNQAGLNHTNLDTHFVWRRAGSNFHITRCTTANINCILL